MQQKLVRCFWSLTSSGLFNDTCEIVKLPPRDASLYKKMRNLPKKENGAQSSNFPSHPPRSRIDESITGLEENSQSVNHGDGQNIFCYVPMQEMLNMLISLQFMYLISHL